MVDLNVTPVLKGYNIVAMKRGFNRFERIKENQAIFQGFLLKWWRPVLFGPAVMKLRNSVILF